MAHLLTDSSPTVLKMSYNLLRDASTKRTEQLVVEAGVDTDESVSFQLPDELIDLLKQPVDSFAGDGDNSVSNNVFVWSPA
jgi:hypothetical protein